MECKICSAATRTIGSVAGKHIQTDFLLVRCTVCGFVAVENPCTDYGRLYDENYYHGRGADPLVDYAFELESPTETVRLYEWRGIVEAVTKLAGGRNGWTMVAALAVWLDMFERIRAHTVWDLKWADL